MRTVLESKSMIEWSINQVRNNQLSTIQKLQGSEDIIMKDHDKPLWNDFSLTPVRPYRFFLKSCSGLALLSSHPEAGKTLISLGLAQTLTRWQQPVLLVDLDWKESTLQTILQPPVFVAVENLISDPAFALKEGVVSLGGYLDFLGMNFSAFDFHKNSGVGQQIVLQLLNRLTQLGGNYAYIIFDTASGMDELNLALLQNKMTGVFVSAADPESLLDTFTLLRAVAPHLNRPDLRLILNRILDYHSGETAQHTMRYALHHFMDQEIKLLGMVPFEEDLYISGLSAFPFAKNSSAFDKIQQIARKLQGDHQAALRLQPMDYPE